MDTEIDIFGSCRSSCYISRKISLDSARDLAFRHSLSNYFVGQEIKPKTNNNMAVTLVEKGEVQRARNLHSDIGHLAARDLIPRIVEPMPESALKDLDLKVIDIDFFSRRLGRTCIVLILDDPDNILYTERQIFTNRLSEDINWRQFEPHLTIAKINDPNPKTEVKSWLESRCPASITVEPVTASQIVPLHFANN